MKRLLVSVLAALSLTAFGALEQVARVQLADSAAFVKGVAKLGELTGNQQLGLMVSMAITKIPAARFFGPERPGVPSLYAIFADAKGVSKLMQDIAAHTNGCGVADSALDSSFGWATLYPVAQSKADFLAGHPGATEKDGVITVPHALADDDDDDAPSLAVVFSADGKWAAMSDNPTLAKRVIKEVRSAEAKMNGNLAKLSLSSTGLRMLGEAYEVMRANTTDPAVANLLSRALTLLKCVSSAAFTLRVNDAGLDIRSYAKIAKNGIFETICTKSIEDAAWKNVDPKAVVACLSAANVGADTMDWKKWTDLLAKYGIKTDSFLAVTNPSANYSIFTLDVPALIAYSAELEKIFEKVDCAAFKQDAAALQKFSAEIPTDTPARGSSLVLKGYAPKAETQARFEKTLPETKGKSLLTASVFSVYSIVKALMPFMTQKLDVAAKAMLDPLLQALPPEGTGAIALATWREKESFHGILRVSADELKGLSSLTGAVMAYQMSQAMMKAQNQQLLLKNQPADDEDEEDDD